jgi:hypothetical protein
VPCNLHLSTCGTNTGCNNDLRERGGSLQRFERAAARRPRLCGAPRARRWAGRRRPGQAGELWGGETLHTLSSEIVAFCLWRGRWDWCCRGVPCAAAPLPARLAPARRRPCAQRAASPYVGACLVFCAWQAGCEWLRPACAPSGRPTPRRQPLLPPARGRRPARPTSCVLHTHAANPPAQRTTDSLALHNMGLGFGGLRTAGCPVHIPLAALGLQGSCPRLCLVRCERAALGAAPGSLQRRLAGDTVAACMVDVCTAPSVLHIRRCGCSLGPSG